MHPQKFELFCRGLLTNMGVDIEESVGVQYVADGGLDGFGYITSEDFRTTRVALQAKRWDRKVSAPEIDKFRGAMDKYNAEYGIFVTTSDFTRDAMRVAKSGTRIITLINGDKICDLVARYHYYVEEVTTYKLKSFYTNNE
ncbi:Mrr restriction system protein [Tetragenococcus halophilus NBRC 12172]|uniref:Mrr restriction system protein n=2 Tax=Tetragenococcus TaxID=51668 RepID=A0AAN1VRL7_TETHN|nr:Mrr restriction system protein [Tetragenococcus halophilus NBRC 12172]GBD70188.1 mrr restriction system protein [Tetragenococcus halophilus subsp. halophilus]